LKKKPQKIGRPSCVEQTTPTATHGKSVELAITACNKNQIQSSFFARGKNTINHSWEISDRDRERTDQVYGRVKMGKLASLQSGGTEKRNTLKGPHAKNKKRDRGRLKKFDHAETQGGMSQYQNRAGKHPPRSTQEVFARRKIFRGGRRDTDLRRTDRNYKVNRLNKNGKPGKKLMISFANRKKDSDRPRSGQHSREAEVGGQL